VFEISLGVTYLIYSKDYYKKDIITSINRLYLGIIAIRI